MTLNRKTKRAIIESMFAPENKLFRVAQDAAPSDVDVDEKDFAGFLEDCYWTLVDEVEAYNI